MSTQTIESERSTNRVKAVPDGYHTLTPHLVVKGASEAIEFYKKARLFLVDEWLCFVDEFSEMQCRGPQSVGGTPVTIHMYFEDVDAAFKRAVAAGAQVRMPLEDMFWGDRYGVLADPFGHAWSLATHKEDLKPEEIAARAQTAFSGCAPPA